MKEYRYKINGNLYKVTVGDIEENQVQVEVNGTPYKVELEKKATPKIKPVMRTASTTPAAPPPAVSRPAAPSSKGSIKSPLPGVILDVKVKEGDAVKRGQTLMILEAMKMENEIMAPCDGTIKQVVAAKGASVNSGDPLIVIG